MAHLRKDSTSVATVATENVYFVCQRCCQPLTLHESFHTVGSEELAQLAAPLVGEGDSGAASNDLTRQTPAASASDDDVIRRNVSRMRGASTTYQDFALLTSPNRLEMGNLSYRLKVSSQLFDIMSGNGEVDHPLCQECTGTLMDNMVKQLGHSEKELKMYQDYLAKLEHAPLPEETGIQRQLDELTGQEQELIEQLKHVEGQRAQVAVQMSGLEEEQKQLELEEEKHFNELCEHQHQERALLGEQQSVDSQLQHAQAQLNTLEKTNVYNCAFYIWADGHFGTINGFRLGRLQTVPVEWSEINTAWGQAALLLHCLARRLKVRFEGYRLVPYGNLSYIETTLQEKRKQLPLYSASGMRIFSDTKFDNGMAAYLKMMGQFQEQVEAMAKQDPGPKRKFTFPCIIKDDTIGESNGQFYSISSVPHFGKLDQGTEVVADISQMEFGFLDVEAQP